MFVLLVFPREEYSPPFTDRNTSYSVAPEAASQVRSTFGLCPLRVTDRLEGTVGRSQRGVNVFVGVRVSVGVDVLVGVLVRVDVGVAVDVEVAVGVELDVDVGVGEGPGVLGVFVGFFVAVGSTGFVKNVGEGVKVSVDVGVGVEAGGKGSEITYNSSWLKLPGFKSRDSTQQSNLTLGHLTLYQSPSRFVPRTLTSSKASMSASDWFDQSKQPACSMVTAS